MARKRNDFRLGITLIVMFVLFLSCLLFVGSEGLFKAPMREFAVRFVAGPAMPEIVPGSRVMCFGQGVGKVVETHLVTGHDPGAPARRDVQFLEVRATALAELDLREDCTVVATGPPLGGKGTLEIIDRGVAAAALAPDQPLYGRTVGFQTALTQLTSELDDHNPDGLLSLIKLQLDAGDARSLMAKIHRSVEDLNVMTESLARELGRTHDTTLMAKVHGGLEKINLALSELVGLMRENRPTVSHSLASVDRALQRIDTQIVAVLSDELDAEREGSVLARTHAAFARLNRSLADLNEITSSSRRVVVLNADRIDELVENATQASMHLNTGIKDLKLHPWKLLFQPSAAEKRELHVLNIAREFAEAAAHLDDATSRLKALLDAAEGDIDGDDAKLTEIRAHLAASVKKYFEAEQALWRELKIK